MEVQTKYLQKENEIYMNHNLGTMCCSIFTRVHVDWQSLVIIIIAIKLVLMITSCN